MPSFRASDGGTLRYQTHGQGSTLCLIHGWSGSAASFGRNVDQLAQHFLVLTYDQRFHGCSDKVARDVSVARLAQDLNELLQNLQLQEPISLLGTSTGCAVIWSYIQQFGQSGLGKLVFVDQAPLQNRTADWQLGSKGCYDDATLRELQHLLQTNMKQFAQGNLESCASIELPPDVASQLESETLQCDGAQLGALMADHTKLDWRPLLPQIRRPCLNLIGCKSGIFPVQGTEAVSQLIRECMTAYFADANHWLYIEQPEAFNQVVTAFLSGQDIHPLPAGVSCTRPE